MLSMLKLLATTILLGSILSANSDAKIEGFLKESFSNNPAILDLTVKITERVQIPSMKGWEALIVVVDADVKGKVKKQKVRQKMIWFTDGNVITKELIDINSRESLKELIAPSFKAEYYRKENLIYGNANAKHKVAIFSDPLCPFCSTFVPQAIKEMKKRPDTFAIYYYHFPLPSIHPAAIELSQAAIVAEMQGLKDVVLRMYDVEVDAKERDVKKILNAFNKTMGTNIKPSDLANAKVRHHFQTDLMIADELMVAGTPTMFFDGKLDKSKRKYQKVK